MCPYEERIRAVKLYIKLGRRLGATLRKLGYPTKNSLISWYREYEDEQDLQVGYSRAPSKYSAEQKQRRVQHYLDHDQCIASTLRAMGYPCRDLLTRWIDELHPQLRQRMEGRAPNTQHPPEVKNAAVLDLCTRTTSARSIAESVGVCRPTLYNWKNQLLGREASTSMKRRKNSQTAPIPKDLTELEQHVALLERDIRRLQLEHDLLKKANELLKKGLGVAPQLLSNRDFQADSPNEKWLTDITEFQIPAGKVYLSPMIDCFDGLVVSLTIGTRPDSDLVNTMLDGAIERVSDSAKKPVIHSDRGAHYRWPGWLQRVNNANLIRSMSRKGCSPDNAACEGFFGRLKTELFYPRSWQDVSVDQFIGVVDDYIHWYNEKRIKISLGSLSPIEYRASLGISV